MKEKPRKLCDHTSVGVIIRDDRGRFLLLKRAIFPVGIAPPAGHIDTHGSPAQAAIAEVAEEVGLVIAPKDLHETIIQKRQTFLPCSRPEGDWHAWWIYTANHYSGELRPDKRETKGAEWYSGEQLQALADRTRAFQAGQIPAAQYQDEPGLEPVWIGFFLELGDIT
jgi:8-oxo-dGTP pyrophosphatase MutT (NUDIX family)